MASVAERHIFAQEFVSRPLTLETIPRIFLGGEVKFMPGNISWKLNLEIQSGPNIVVSNAVQVDAYDRIEVKVPDSTAAPAATTVDVQPGAAGKVKLLLIRANKYGDALKYKVHDDTTPERILNDALFLVGAGSMDLLEDPGKPLDKLLVTNTTGQDVVLEIIVGRSAI